MDGALAWLGTGPPPGGAGLWLGISAASVVASVLGVAMVPWLVGRLPAGWFARQGQGFGVRLAAHPGLTIAQNALGFGLIALGIALLFLPGQGLLTILLGLLLTDLPARDRALRSLAQRPAIARALQALRARRGQPPFEGLPGA